MHDNTHIETFLESEGGSKREKDIETENERKKSEARGWWICSDSQATNDMT